MNSPQETGQGRLVAVLVPARGEDSTPQPEPTEREELEARIRQAHNLVTELEAQREDLALQISAATDMLSRWGIAPAGFKSARKASAMDADKRRHADASYAICRAALGIPLQEELPLA